MQATWSQPVAEEEVFSNDFASRRACPRRPWATSTRARRAGWDGTLTTFLYDEYVWRALPAGASGFLPKRSSPERLIDAVRTVADGGSLLDPAVTRSLIHRYPAGGSPAPAPDESRTL